jgi:PI-3-kinase-related kinase SMG-1
VINKEINHSHTLNLADVNPTLADFDFAGIPIPGINNRKVTIRSIDPVVSVLSTKTKPKKLTFIGTDGKSYSYLLKGKFICR